MHRSARLVRSFVVVAAAATIVAGTSSVAIADVVLNNVIANGNDTIVTGGSTAIAYSLQATSTPTGDVNGCDATGVNPVTVTPTVPPGVTKSPASQSLAGCGSSVSFTFGSSTVGDYSITVQVTGGKPGSAFTTSGATWTLHVRAPNTAPHVSVSGPVDGASYEKGSVPAAACNVNDAEDGNSTFGASLSALTGAFATYGLGSQTASCSYTDAGGLTASAAVTYSIVDTIAPVLSVPGDITKEATSSSGATATWTSTATDAVDPAPTVVCTPASGGTFPLGSTLVKCTATDEVGNASSKQFDVIVQDTTPPVLSLPPDQTLEATGPDGASVTYVASAHDIVDGAVPATCDPTSGSMYALGTTPVNCSATDSSNNSTSAGFNVTVQDTTPPTLNLPADQTLEAAGPDGAQLEYAATADDVVDGTVTVVCDSPSGTLFGLGATTVSCAATDAHGNTANGSFAVSVRDTTAPSLNLPANITQEATKQAGADVDYSASASDLVDGNIVPVCLPSSGSTFSLGTTKVDCSATDAHGNEATGSFDVTVSDTTPPALTNVPGDQTLEATGPDGAVATFTLPTATDIVDGSDTVVCSASSGATFALGSTTVNCWATDAHDNTGTAQFAITVQDTTPPVLSGVPGNTTVEATGPAGATATFDTPTAADLVDGDVAVSCDATSGATFSLGVHTVTCSTVDAAGNGAHASFTITVHDTTAPDVTVPSNITEEATGPSGATATFTASANDTVDGQRPVACSPESGSTFPLGATTVTCTAYDLSNNKGENGFMVTVRDTTPPVLTVPSDITSEATGPSGAAVSFAASANDIVDGAVAPVCTVGGHSVASGDTFPLGVTTVTCTATDQANNTSAAQAFHVDVQDTTPPAITVPADITAEATGPTGAVVTYAASAADLVDGSVTPSCSPASGSTFALGNSTVSCTATDAHGNQSTKGFTVSVQDTTAPVIDSLPNITALATSAGGAVVTYTANATDLVDGTIAASCTPTSGALFAPGTTTVTCNAVDAHGNHAVPKAFVVTVKFDFSGFLAPIDTNKVLNGMKAGSTAPMKWQISDQAGGYISTLGVVNRLSSGVLACDSTALADDLSEYATGSTALRYDSTANQYIYNWQSPKKPGTCYAVIIGLTDGTLHTVLFQLR